MEDGFKHPEAVPTAVLRGDVVRLQLSRHHRSHLMGFPGPRFRVRGLVCPRLDGDTETERAHAREAQAFAADLFFGARLWKFDRGGGVAREAITASCRSTQTVAAVSYRMSAATPEEIQAGACAYAAEITLAQGDFATLMREANMERRECYA